MRPYNGFSHEERVGGWQCIWWLIAEGAMPKARKCAISGLRIDMHYHCEDYYHPWTAVALSRPIHLALHRRFTHPAAWLAIVERYSVSGSEWFALLTFQRTDIAAQLRAMSGSDVCNVYLSTRRYRDAPQ